MPKKFVVFALILVLHSFGRSDAALITGVTIQDVSSELTQNYTRGAANTVNAPGLGIHGPNTYSNVPDGNMWLNSGNGCCGGVSNTGPGNADSSPQITWNLGGIYDVANMRVWNYNENSGNPAVYTLRGIHTADIYTSINGISYTFLEHATLNQASGSDTVDFSQVIPLNAVAADIRFTNIVAFAGVDNNFVGLSAVQFSGTLTPEPSTFILGGLGLVGLLVAARRRKA